MPKLYHGTVKENVDTILKEGFKPGTYFGKGLEDAVGFGGDYVFEIWLDEDPNDYWEWICNETITPDKIINIIKYDRELIYDNKDKKIEIKKFHIKEEYGDDATICDECNGRGQYEEYGPLVRLRDRPVITACNKCTGYGKVMVDGSHPLDYVRKDNGQTV